jgi:hypothetical protein
MATKEFEQQPGAVHAELFTRLVFAYGLTNQGEYERLGRALDRKPIRRVT